MLTYTFKRFNEPDLLIKAASNRELFRRMNEIAGQKSTTKLSRAMVRAAGIQGIFLGRTLIFPVKQKRVRTPKKDGRRHPRLVRKKGLPSTCGGMLPMPSRSTFVPSRAAA